MHKRSIITLISGTMFTLLSIAVIGEIFIALGVSLVVFSDHAFGILAWYAFAIVSGVFMVVLPTTLPLAFTVVSLVSKKGFARGMCIALVFSSGVMLTLVLYGIFSALFGGAFFGAFGISGEVFRGSIYLFGGLFAYALALGELGLIDFRMSAYAGAVPKFFGRGSDVRKALLLGLFLGNIGVGSGSPAVPLLLFESAISGNALYGGMLFLAHGFGRVLPLIILAFIASAGIYGARALTTHKAKFEHMNGMFMIVCSAAILTIGLFSLEWFAGMLGVLAHVNVSEYIRGWSGMLFPFTMGNWILLVLLLVPLWWHYVSEFRRVRGSLPLEIRRIDRSSQRLEEERRGYESAAHLLEGAHGERLRHIERELDVLAKKRRMIEEAQRFGAKHLRDASEDFGAKGALLMRCWWYVTLSLLLFIVLIAFVNYA